MSMIYIKRDGQRLLLLLILIIF